MLVDASALAAMLADETKARFFGNRLQQAEQRVTTPACVLDALVLLNERTGIAADRLAEIMARFLPALGIRTLTLAPSLLPAATEAMVRFGETPSRPDGLTANQCLSYAAARYYRMPLLFDDPRFAATDIEAG